MRQKAFLYTMITIAQAVTTAIATIADNMIRETESIKGNATSGTARIKGVNRTNATTFPLEKKLFFMKTTPQPCSVI